MKRLDIFFLPNLTLLKASLITSIIINGSDDCDVKYVVYSDDTLLAPFGSTEPLLHVPVSQPTVFYLKKALIQLVRYLLLPSNCRQTQFTFNLLSKVKHLADMETDLFLGVDGDLISMASQPIILYLVT